MFEGNVLNLPSEDESFEALISRLKWSKIIAVIRGRRDLRNRYQLGGYAINKENRERAISILKKYFSEFQDRAVILKRSLFMEWYSSECNSRGKIDRYFESDSYRDYIEEKEFLEGFYYLSDDKFKEFSFLWDQEEARFFLFFSPIKFSLPQAERLATVEVSQAQNDIESKYEKREKDLQGKLGKSLEDVRALRKELKKSRAESKKNLREISELRRSVDESQGRYDQLVEVNNKLQRLSDSREKNVGELQAKIRELVGERKKLTSQKSMSENLAEKLRFELDKREESFREILDKSPIDRALSDPKVCRSIFNKAKLGTEGVTAIEELLQDHLESTANLGIEGFWNAVGVKEEEKIGALSKITASDASKDRFCEKWLETEDLFEDLEYLLLAKLALVRSIHGLFCEVSSGLGNQEDGEDLGAENR